MQCKTVYISSTLGGGKTCQPHWNLNSDSKYGRNFANTCVRLVRNTSQAPRNGKVRQIPYYSKRLVRNDKTATVSNDNTQNITHQSEECKRQKTWICLRVRQVRNYNKIQVNERNSEQNIDYLHKKEPNLDEKLGSTLIGMQITDSKWNNIE